MTDQEAAFCLIRELKRRYRFKKGAIFIADKAYDVRALYTFIVEQMKSTPYIPINPRNQKDDKTFGPHGCPLCDAGLEMKSEGKWTEDYGKTALLTMKRCTKLTRNVTTAMQHKNIEISKNWLDIPNPFKRLKSILFSVRHQ